MVHTRLLPRLLPLAAVVACSTLLSACGGSGHLIPAAQAGPLRDDFEAVYTAAGDANGNCRATKDALSRTDRDFQALPASVDGKLRNTLRDGIENLHTVALRACRQPAAPPPTSSATHTTPTSTSTTSSTTTTTTTSTTTEEPTTTSTTSYPPPPSTSANGGTEAPESGGAPEVEGEGESGGFQAGEEE